MLSSKVVAKISFSGTSLKRDAGTVQAIHTKKDTELSERGPQSCVPKQVSHNCTEAGQRLRGQP